MRKKTVPPHLPLPARWWRASGGTITPVDVVACDTKTVTRLFQGRQIRSRRAKGGVFYCPDWEEARQCLLQWNENKAKEAQVVILCTIGWHDPYRDYQCKQAQVKLQVCERHRAWLEGLKPPA